VRTIYAAACATLVFLYGCSQPPLKEIAAAEELLARARASGADRYAPDRLNEAQAAITLARQKVEQKDYRSALSAALDAAEKSRQASSAAAAARAAARHAAEKALADARRALAKADEVRGRAAAAGVPDRVFAEPARAAEDLRQRAEGVSAALAKDDLPEAQQQAAELQKRAAELPERFQAAQRRWQSTRPRPRPAARPGRR
jgi:hypothetical protein